MVSFGSGSSPTFDPDPAQLLVQIQGQLLIRIWNTVCRTDELEDDLDDELLVPDCEGVAAALLGGC